MKSGCSFQAAALWAWLVAVGVAGHGAEVAVLATNEPQAGAPAASSEVGASSEGAEPRSAPLGQSGLDSILNLDLDQLAQIAVSSQPQRTDLTAPSGQLNAASAETGEATTTAELLRQAPGVSVRRLSGITLDPQVRGYHAGQLNATANGMNQLKARVDIDSLFNQIDPGIIHEITIVDGPYTSLYGPGFAFLIADLLPAPRFSEGLQTHFSTNFVYGSNAQTLYSRDNVVSGGTDWGACLSYGLRAGNDYLPGGESPFPVPASYQRWDGLLAVGFDLDRVSRIEFNLLRNEMNDVEVPGVVHDIDSLTNDQFNLRYIVQEDPYGPKQLVLQSWYTQTPYHGDASRVSKQQSLYRAFFSESNFFEYPVNTVGSGSLESLGARLLRTFGDADSAQLTVGADWRRYRQHYEELDLNAAGELVFFGDVFGIPRSQIDDIGALMDLSLPVSDAISVNIGGRVDQSKAIMDRTDPVVTVFRDMDEYFYYPGFAQPSNTLGMAYITAKRKLTENTTLKAGTAFAMRMPDLAELYGDEPYVPFARFGNSYLDGLSTLRPEKNLQLDLGLGYETKKVSYGVRGFGSFIHDYIMPVPAFIDPSAPDFIHASKVLGRDFRYFPPQQRTDIGTTNENADTNQAGYQYVNLDEAVLLGGDLFAQFQVLDGLSLFGSMSYVYGVNNEPVAFVHSENWSSLDGQVVPLGGSDGLPGIYPLNGTLGLRVFEPAEDRWCLEFAARMVRGQDHVAVTLAEIPAPGYTTFAMRGYYRWNKNVRISLVLENLLNRAYSEPGSPAITAPSGLAAFVQEPGFSSLLGVDARF